MMSSSEFADDAVRDRVPEHRDGDPIVVGLVAREIGLAQRAEALDRIG